MTALYTCRAVFIVLTDGYDINNIAYKWEMSSEDGMSFVPSDMKMLPQFKLTKLQLSTLFTTYVVGKYEVHTTFTTKETEERILFIYLFIWVII